MKGEAIVTMLRTDYKCSDGCCYEEWYDVTISINEEEIMTERYIWEYNEDYVVDIKYTHHKRTKVLTTKRM